MPRGIGPLAEPTSAPLNKQHREEVVRDVRSYRLEARLRANCQVKTGRSQARLAWGAALAFLLRSASLAGRTVGRGEEQR